MDGEHPEVRDVKPGLSLVDDTETTLGQIAPIFLPVSLPWGKVEMFSEFDFVPSSLLQRVCSLSQAVELGVGEESGFSASIPLCNVHPVGYLDVAGTCSGLHFLPLHVSTAASGVVTLRPCDVLANKALHRIRARVADLQQRGDSNGDSVSGGATAKQCAVTAPHDPLLCKSIHINEERMAAMLPEITRERSSATSTAPRLAGIVVDGYCFQRQHIRDADLIVCLKKLEKDVVGRMSAVLKRRVVLHPLAKEFFYPDPCDAYDKKLIPIASFATAMTQLRSIEKLGWHVHTSPFKKVITKAGAVEWRASAEDVNFANCAARICATQLPPADDTNFEMKALDHLVIVTGDNDHKSTFAATVLHEVRWLVYLGEGFPEIRRDAQKLKRYIRYTPPTEFMLTEGGTGEPRGEGGAAGPLAVSPQDGPPCASGDDPPPYQEGDPSMVGAAINAVRRKGRGGRERGGGGGSGNGAPQV